MDLIENYIITKCLISTIESEFKKALNEQEFCYVHVGYICTIGKREGISIKDICMTSGVDKGQATRVVGDLISMGAVENRSEDSRRYSLFLTGMGKIMFSYANLIAAQIGDELFEEFTDDEIVQFSYLLSKMDKTLKTRYKY